MKQSQMLFSIGIAVFIVIVTAGCSNPADNKPVAEVSEVVEKPATTPTASEATPYVLSDSSTITWTGSKVTGSHDGGFNTVTGTASVVTGDSLASSINITIDTQSIWSDNEKLTNHLKSADFFDVVVYPKAEFESTKIVASGAVYDVTGNLTLHGVTKSITFPAQIEVSDDRLSAQAEFVLNRMDFGIVYPGMANDLIRAEVVVKFDVTAVPQ